MAVLIGIFVVVFIIYKIFTSKGAKAATVQNSMLELLRSDINVKAIDYISWDSLLEVAKFLKAKFYNYEIDEDLKLVPTVFTLDAKYQERMYTITFFRTANDHAVIMEKKIKV